MLRVECLANGLDTRPRYGLLASVAVRCKVLVVILFTVELAPLLNEALVLKRFTASIADKMMRMPCLANCTNKRAKDFLAASITEGSPGLFNWLCRWWLGRGPLPLRLFGRG